MLTEKLDAELKRLRIGGLVLTALGVVLLLIAVFVLKTYVSSTQELGPDATKLAEVLGADMTERTNNIGLIARQQIITLLGGFTMIAGLLLYLGSLIARVLVEEPRIG